jgi:ketosteroid isomerase-like protein
VVSLAAFTDAFNRNDLDAAMEAFAEQAVYEPGDGKTHRGRAAIRAALAPQFAGALGKMRFDLIEEFGDARRAALRWTCHHDIGGEHGRAMSAVLRLAVRLRHGTRIKWQGVDIFHFDETGKITGKFTYAGYTRPRLERA